jgi:hypothetical protein
MLSLLPVLVHDADLPPTARAALQVVQTTPAGFCQDVAKQRAAATLAGLFDLTEREVADLIGLPFDLRVSPAAAARCS